MDLPMLENYNLIHVDICEPIDVQNELHINSVLDRRAKALSLSGPFISAKFNTPNTIHKFAEQDAIVSFARYYPKQGG